MPIIVPGYSTEQSVYTVPNNDAEINEAISDYAELGWIVVSLTLSGANMVILFTRTIPLS